MRHYLIVAYQTLGGDELMQAIKELLTTGPSDFYIVVPATPAKDLTPTFVPPMPVMGGPLSLPAPPEESRRLAQAKLETALKQLSAAGVKADGEVGHADPMVAVEAVLARRPVDEIIVSTLPERLSRWLRQDLPTRLEHKFGVPVAHLTVTKVSRR